MSKNKRLEPHCSIALHYAATRMRQKIKYLVLQLTTVR